MRNVFPALALGLTSILFVTVLSTPASAEDKKAAPIHVRGSIVDYQGSTLKVKMREGETIDIALADDWKVAGVAEAKVTDIKPGDFVGIASMP